MIKINLGCGWRDFGKDWHHVDGGDYPHLDSRDIFNLPFEDDSVDIIYVSHVIGYFNRQEIVEILEKWKAKLKPKGTIRVATPDFKTMARLYYNGQYSLDDFLGPLYGKMQMGPDTIYHKTTYDFKDLKEVLLSAGFNNVNRYDWEAYNVHRENDDHSQAYLPHLDKENGTLISLNVEAKK